MTKDAGENFEEEPNNPETFSKESTEDQNENRNVVSSMEERSFENSHVNISLSTNDDTSCTLDAIITGLVRKAKNLQNNNVFEETDATVKSFVDIEKSATNLQLKPTESELPSSTSSDNSHETESEDYFSESFSKTKNPTLIPQQCSNQEDICNFDNIPSSSEEEQSSMKIQINECINTLKDITDKTVSSSSLPIRDIELKADINSPKPTEELSVDNIESKENSSSNTRQNWSSKSPFSTDYVSRSPSNVILCEEKDHLKEENKNNPKDVKEHDDEKAKGKETGKSESLENSTKKNNSDCLGYKSECMRQEPKSLIALIQAYKSEKFLKIVNKFFDSKDSLKADDKTNLSENKILEATHQCFNEVTDDHHCLNRIWSHNVDSNKEIESNELCKNHTTVSKKNFNDSKNREAIETTNLLSEKSSCEEMGHEKDTKEKCMSISFERNSEQLSEGAQESNNKDDVRNTVCCPIINSTSNDYKESKLRTEPRLPLQEILSRNCTENPNLNANSFQNNTKCDTKVEIHYIDDDPFQTQISSDIPIALSETDKENSICEEVNETDQYTQSDSFLPIWLDQGTDQIEDHYPFKESSIIQQPKDLMVTEVVKQPSDTPMMLLNTNKEISVGDEGNKTDLYTQSDSFIPIWLHSDTDQTENQYSFEESSYVEQPKELIAAEVVKVEPEGIEIGNYLDQYSGEGDIFDNLRNLNRNVDFTSFDNVFSSDVAYPSFDLIEPTFQIDRFSTPIDSASSSKEFSETISNSIKEEPNLIPDKKKNPTNLRIQILSRKDKPALGTFYDNSESLNKLAQSSSPVYGTIKIRTQGNGTTTFQSFSFSPSVDKNTQQYTTQNKVEHTCLGVLRPIKKGVRIEGGDPGIPSETRRVLFAEKPMENKNESGFTKFVPSVKLIVPKEINQVNTNTEGEKNEKENSRIKLYPCSTGTKGKDAIGSVISYFSKAAGLTPSSSSQKFEMDNVQAKSLGPKRSNDAKPNDGKPSPPKLNLLPTIVKELSTESLDENIAHSTNRKATPLPTAMISSRTRSKRLSLTEETSESNTPLTRTSKKMRHSDGDVKTPPIIKISEIVDNYAAKFHNASAGLQQRIPKKDFSKKQLLEKVFQDSEAIEGDGTPNTATTTIADLTLAAVQELNGGQGSTVFDIMSYVRSRVSRDDVNVSQGVRETLKEAAGVGNIQLKSGRYVVTQTLVGKEKAKPKNAKRKSSAIELPRRTKSLRIFRKPYDENDPCL